MTTDRAREGLSRREVVRLLGWTGVSSLLPRWTVQAAVGGAIRIGVRAESLAALPVLIAAQQGYFRAAGVDPEIRVYQDELSIGVFLASGELDLGVLPTPMLFAVDLGIGPFQGRGREMVTCQVALTNGAVLLVAADSEIKYSRQFRDHAIAVSDRLDMPTLLTDIYLKQSGLTPGQDTRWEVQGLRQIRRALAAGEIGGTAIGGVPAGRLLASGEARVMVPLHKLWAEYPAEVIAASRRFQQQRNEDHRRVSAATMRAAAELAAGVPASLEDAPRLSRAVEETRAGFHPFPYLSGLRVILEEMKKRGLTPLNTDLKGVAERVALTGLCRELMTPAGFASVPAEDSRDERMIGCCYTFF